MENSDISSSGALTDTCPTPFATQFETISQFFLRFRLTTNNPQILIDLFESHFDFDVWTFRSTDSYILHIMEETPSGSNIISGTGQVDILDIFLKHFIFFNNLKFFDRGKRN